MKILIDIKHPAQLNLFKGLSRELAAEDWEVTICYLKRGKLPKIMAAEYAGFHTIPVGSSRGTKWSILWDGNLKRTLTFLNLIRKNNYNICVAASSIPLALACKIAGVPVIQFYDDPERGKVNWLNARFSNQLFFPPIIAENNKTSTFRCLKEWSYLSPTRFRPDPEVLQEYGLLPHQYLFMREVSNKSFNYYDQEDGIIGRLVPEIDPGNRVLLSLEDKSLADQFPAHWTLLQEPVRDIHSLIYYSKLVVSSGDSMAREGAMLGVPSVYCGIRKMKANELLMGRGLLQHLPLKEAVPFINRMAATNFDSRQQLNARQALLADWVDMVGFMKEQINNYKN
jgi:predicted glycosyltransferase